VTNAQHFDAFAGNAALAGYDTRVVPGHYYYLKALDLMYAHLKGGAAIPPSQVVRTVPRGGTPGMAPALQISPNLPPIAPSPGADAITFANGTLTVPD
jgi:hydroxybutyrate-dimer hydrolase